MICSKTGLVVVNVILLFSSFGLVSVGSLVQNYFHGTSGLLSGFINLPAAIMTAFGVGLACVSLLGIVSVYGRNYGLLFPYMCILLALVILNVVVIITSISLKRYTLRFMTKSLLSSQSQYNTHWPIASNWDSLQQNFECCGVNHFEEWFAYFDNSSVPDSCCIKYSIGCGRFVTKSDIYTAGCASVIRDWFQRNEVFFYLIVMYFIFLELLSFLLYWKYVRVLNHYVLIAGNY